MLVNLILLLCLQFRSAWQKLLGTSKSQETSCDVGCTMVSKANHCSCTADSDEKRRSKLPAILRSSDSPKRKKIPLMVVISKDKDSTTIVTHVYKNKNPNKLAKSISTNFCEHTSSKKQLIKRNVEKSSSVGMSVKRERIDAPVINTAKSESQLCEEHML